MVENMSNHSEVNVSPTSVSTNGGSGGGVQKGVAGRINYAAWDKVATELVQQVEEEDEQEKAEETRKVSCFSLLCCWILTTRDQNRLCLAGGGRRCILIV
jgi:hypothetical protein